MKSAYVSLIFAAILYGSISTIAKPALNTINPILLSSLIYLIIGISLTTIVKMKNNVSNVDGYKLKLIFLDSICGAVIGPILYFYGLTLTEASVASLLINTEFLFSILLAFYILKERPGKTTYIGIACILGGLLILNIKFDDSNFLQNNNIIGNVFIIGATFFWALDNNISKIILQKKTPIIKIMQIKSLLGGLVSLAIIPILNIPLTVNLCQIPNLLFLSLGGFAGSLFLFLKGMQRVGTITSVMIFSTSSIFGILFALIFLQESIDVWNFILSVVLVLAGIYLITRNI